MKRFSLGLVAAGLTASIGAYAALPTGAAPFQVNVPNLMPGFEFNVTGLYLRPTLNNLDYATVSTSSASNTNMNVLSVKPGYDLAFGLGIGYVFPDSGNDVRLNWTHFNHGDSDSVNASNGTVINAMGANVSGIIKASGNTNFKYDAVDLDAGQFVNFGTRLQVRMFGGLRYARIENDFSETYVQAQQTNTYSSVSKFSGLGPRVGIDTAYHLGDCFGLVGHVAGSLLVGKIKANSTSVTENASSTTTSTITSNDVNRVVPGVDARLGVNYSYPFNAGSVFSAELGYQVTHYVDAIDQVGYNGVANRITNGVGFDGPYLSLNLKV